MEMDVEEETEKPSFVIKKKPLATIVSMILEKAVGFYIEDDQGNQIEIDV